MDDAILLLLYLGIFAGALVVGEVVRLIVTAIMERA